MRALDSHPRGDPLELPFVLEDGFIGDDFSEIKFTVRKRLPASSEITDASANGQAALTGGGIVMSSDTEGTITILSAVTTTWSPGNYYWDLQGTLDSNDEPYTIDQGVLPVHADVTRAP